MRIEKPLTNLGDNTKVLTNSKMDFIIIELDGDNLIIAKNKVAEFVTALVGAYLEDASVKDISNLTAGIRRKLDITKMRRA